MNYEDVWRLIKKIPRGKVTTYKEIARMCNTRAYRLIGMACKKNPFKDVPYHRVVKSNGELGGYVFGVEEKRRLLVEEGIEIVNGKINLKKHLFAFN
ncbi:MAG: MGMT family protein [Candidatus Aenigmatarchaeota archaeon]